MKLEKITVGPYCEVEAVIDGIQFLVGEKRSFLDHGYALLIPVDDPGQEWIDRNSGGFPGAGDVPEVDGPGFVQEPRVVDVARRVALGEIIDPVELTF